MISWFIVLAVAIRHASSQCDDDIPRHYQYHGGLTLSADTKELVDVGGAYLKREDDKTRAWFKPSDFKAKKQGYCHLDGAFFRGFGGDAQHNGIWQFYMDEQANRHKETTRLTEEGAAFAGRHRDSANYNLYMWVWSEQVYTKDAPPYVFQVVVPKGVRGNFCTQYATNNMLQYMDKEPTCLRKGKDEYASDQDMLFDYELGYGLQWDGNGFYQFAKKGMGGGINVKAKGFKAKNYFSHEEAPAFWRKHNIVGLQCFFELKKKGAHHYHWVVYKYLPAMQKWYVLDPNVHSLLTEHPMGFDTIMEARKTMWAFWKGKHEYSIPSEAWDAVYKGDKAFGAMVNTKIGKAAKARALDAMWNDNYVWNMQSLRDREAGLNDLEEPVQAEEERDEARLTALRSRRRKKGHRSRLTQGYDDGHHL